MSVTEALQSSNDTMRSSLMTRSVGIVSGIFGYAFATAWRTDAHGAVALVSTPTYFGCWRRWLSCPSAFAISSSQPGLLTSTNTWLARVERDQELAE